MVRMKFGFYNKCKTQFYTMQIVSVLGLGLVLELGILKSVWPVGNPCVIYLFIFSQ